MLVKVWPLRWGTLGTDILQSLWSSQISILDILQISWKLQILISVILEQGLLLYVV